MSDHRTRLAAFLEGLDSDVIPREQFLTYVFTHGAPEQPGRRQPVDDGGVVILRHPDRVLD